MTDLAPRQRATILHSLHAALDHETHNLRRRPRLLWQQLYNRLQWQEEVAPVLQPELGRRSTPVAACWIRTLSPLDESPALVRTFAGNSTLPLACAFGADGAYVIAGSGNTLLLWDTSTGRELRTLTGHTDTVNACAVSPDGAFIVSASADRTLKLWDPASGNEIRTLAGHTAGIGTCAVSPDAAYVVSASIDGTIKLWDVATGAVVRSFAQHNVQCCAVSPTGDYLVTGHAFSGHLTLWDLATGEELRTLTGHAPRSTQAHCNVYDCAISPDASFIISASSDGTLKLWDPATGAELHTLNGHQPSGGELLDTVVLDGSVYGCAVSPDGSYIVAASGDQTLRLWDPTSGTELRTLTGHTARVHACGVSPDGAWIVSAGSDMTLKLWDASVTVEFGLPATHTRRVTSCAFAPDGSYVVSASEDRSLKLWDPTNGREIRTLTGHAGELTLIDGVDEWFINEGCVNDCAVSPDGAYIVSAGDDHTLKLWDPIGGAELRTLTGHHQKLNACGISRDGSYIVAADDCDAFAVWDAAGAKLRTLTDKGVYRPGPRGCRFSPDGTYVATAGIDRTLKLWDVACGRELHGFSGHTDWVNACAFSPSGTLLASASDDETVKLWELRTDREIRSLAGHIGSVTACTFTPDGDYIVSTGVDGTLRVWEVATGAARAVIPLLGSLRCVGLHPWRTLGAWGDDVGSVYLFDLVTIEYGPIGVTAFRRASDVLVTCAKCSNDHVIRHEQLGADMTCPTPGCGLRLRVNRSLAGWEPMPPWERSGGGAIVGDHIQRYLVGTMWRLADSPVTVLLMSPFGVAAFSKAPKVGSWSAMGNRVRIDRDEFVYELTLAPSGRTRAYAAVGGDDRVTLTGRVRPSVDEDATWVDVTFVMMDKNTEDDTPR